VFALTDVANLCEQMSSEVWSSSEWYARSRRKATIPLRQSADTVERWSTTCHLVLLYVGKRCHWQP